MTATTHTGRLVPASKWINETFEAGVSTKTVYNWVANRVIPGVILDGKPFVDADKAAVLLDTHTIITAPSVTPVDGGNATVAQLVQGGLTQ